MPKKKILILGKLPPPFMGPAIATEILLKSSLRNNFEIIHLNTKVNESIGTIGKWSTGKFFRSYAIYWNMFKIMRAGKPDLVLIPFSQATIPFIKDSIFIIIAGLFKRKSILHLRGSNFRGWLDKSSQLTRWYVKKSIGLSSAGIVLGNNLRYLFNEYFPEEKIFVVPNGADFLFPKRTDNSFRILYFANLLPEKGIEDVLHAVKLLADAGKNNFQLEVVGSWSDSRFEKHCKDFVTAHQLPVMFHPPVSGEKKLYHFANSDIFVFPPQAPEGHPWVIVEAMAAGLPIIATDKGAITESVHHGENGYIVKTNSPGEIAERLTTLVNDPTLRNEMGIKSRKIYESGFTENKMVSRLEEVFNKVIAAE